MADCDFFSMLLVVVMGNFITLALIALAAIFQMDEKKKREG